MVTVTFKVTGDTHLVIFTEKSSPWQEFSPHIVVCHISAEQKISFLAAMWPGFPLHKIVGFLEKSWATDFSHYSCWLAGFLAAWLFGSFVVGLPIGLVGWLSGLVGWLAAWLAVWLAG